MIRKKMNVGEKYVGKKVFILTTNKRSHAGKVIDADEMFISLFNGIKNVSIKIDTIEEIKEEE